MTEGATGRDGMDFYYKIAKKYLEHAEKHPKGSAGWKHNLLEAAKYLELAAK